ncbi:PAS domain-containing protein [Halobaculum rubrum]|uniref:PAS domain-containing protein n=1 Tax=Halobaculum rubrum TaxID=2872158 RepID=UPI001CA4347D|nr:PAS domain-containing protein [Halobaculum rubrum]QZX98212.1 PAS domain-containing protein [Halobaculum rubrum]
MNEENDDITVLYVDDEPDLLELLVIGLERESDRLTVLTETSAADGLDRFRDADVDCILSDYAMPGGTGLEFLRSVREIDPDVPFIMFAETGDEHVASEAISAGVTDYVIEKAIGGQHELLARKITANVDRRRAERRAQRTNERLREIAGVANDALWMFSDDWEELLFINEAHERLFGQPTEELRDAPDSFLDRVHPDDVDRVRQAMERASDGNPQSVEYRVHKSDSVVVWLESHCTPIRSDDGTVRRLTGFTRDITDRKRHEQELASRNEQLDGFASTVAHDLRNPINIADGHLGLARQQFDSEHLEASARAVVRMEELLEDLLSLARTGDEIGDTRPIDLAEVVRAAEDNVAMAEASLAIEDTATIECDPTRLKEAAENLLRNAIEHNEGRVEVTVGTLSGDGFFFEDDGVGIPVTEREAVFENGYSTIEKGTGFGLSIVEQVVTAHGWDIGVTSGDADGARFEVTGVSVDQ